MNGNFFGSALRVQLPLRTGDFFYYLPHRRCAMRDDDGRWRIYSPYDGANNMWHDPNVPMWSLGTGAAGETKEILHSPGDFNWGSDPYWEGDSGSLLYYDAGLLSWVLRVGSAVLRHTMPANMSYYVNRAGDRAVEAGDQWWQFNGAKLRSGARFMPAGVDAASRDAYVIEERFSDIVLESPAENMPAGCGQYSDGTVVGAVRVIVQGGGGDGEDSRSVDARFDLSLVDARGQVAAGSYTLKTNASLNTDWDLEGPGGRIWRGRPPASLDNTSMSFSLWQGPAEADGWPNTLTGLLKLGREDSGRALPLAGPDQALMVSGKAWR